MGDLTVLSFITRADSFVGAILVRKSFDAVVITTFWSLWSARNNFVFYSVLPKISSLFDDIISIFISRFLIGVKKLRSRGLHGCLILM